MGRETADWVFIIDVITECLFVINISSHAVSTFKNTCMVMSFIHDSLMYARAPLVTLWSVFR